jgi:hypothetical protein
MRPLDRILVQLVAMMPRMAIEKHAEGEKRNWETRIRGRISRRRREEEDI